MKRVETEYMFCVKNMADAAQTLRWLHSRTGDDSLLEAADKLQVIQSGVLNSKRENIRGHSEPSKSVV